MEHRPFVRETRLRRQEHCPYSFQDCLGFPLTDKSGASRHVMEATQEQDALRHKEDLAGRAHQEPSHNGTSPLMNEVKGRSVKFYE